MGRSTSTAGALLVALLLATTAVAAPEALLAEVAAAHKDVAALQVDFVQTSTGPSYFDPVVQTGTFELERPDRIRWSFETPTKRTYLSDGKTLWIAEDEGKTVQVFGQVDGMVRRYVDLLTGLDGAAEDFVVTELPMTEGRRGLKLVPKVKDDQVASIEVRINDQAHVVAVIVSSPFGDRTDMQLSNRRTPADLPDERFVWAEQPGWHVVPMTGTEP